ncbi:hypothetical protein EVAR_71029_1 [Eumeta japonica]|uniref:Uncharacterized protein n=1 Tax=Eumeta variegata TaxID=151549 RepID=A0A4C1SJ36_EUMVA|nr:hypothetical protein EVAR_71029_1 [Eumeta japonica]
MAPTNKHVKRSQQQHRHQQTHSSREAKRHYGCGICQADHRLTSCHKFKNLNLAEKYKTAVKLHYCINCLARNHLVGKYTSKAKCQKCTGKHHSVLHGPNRILAEFASEQSNPSKRVQNHPPTPTPCSTLVASSSATATVGLPTCLNKVIVPTTEVYVMTENGGVLSEEF